MAGNFNTLILLIAKDGLLLKPDSQWLTKLYHRMIDLAGVSLALALREPLSAILAIRTVTAIGSSI
jgi:hypothetical protein